MTHGFSAVRFVHFAFGARAPIVHLSAFIMHVFTQSPFDVRCLPRPATGSVLNYRDDLTGAVCTCNGWGASEWNGYTRHP